MNLEERPDRQNQVELAGALLEALGDCVLQVADGGACVALFGKPLGLLHCPKSVTGLTLDALLPAQVSSQLRSALSGGSRDAEPRIVEYSLPAAQGSRHFEARVASAPSGSFIVIRDTHARRSAEELLRESEARFRLMADHAPVMLWKAGLDAECDFFNRRWLEFTGRPMERELGSGWLDGVHAEDFAACMDKYLAAFVARRPFRMEYRLKRADGAFRWVLDQGVPRFSPSGSFEGYIGSCIDITELRESGDEIRALNARLHERVRDRELLLREIHHRIKNSLQLVSSLLGLSARQLDGASRGLIESGQSRIQCIALIHEKFYDSQNISDVDLAEYATDLVRTVVVAVGARAGIDVTVSGEPVRLNVDQASPCGLIINELLTNALKHAFPGGRSGSVRIQIASEQLGVALTVADDGVGLPPGFELDKVPSLGLDVVTTLAKQLDAELSVGAGPGTSFRLVFPIRREAA